MTKVESTSTVICPPCWISGWPKFLLFFLIVCYCLFQEVIAPLLAKGFLGAGGAMRKILANVFVSSRIISIIWLLLAMTDECSLCETYGEELCMYLSGCRWCGTSQKCIVRNDNCPSCSSVRKTEVLASFFISLFLYTYFYVLRYFPSLFFVQTSCKGNPSYCSWCPTTRSCIDAPNYLSYCPECSQFSIV